MGNNEEYRSHALFTALDKDAPFEVTSLKKAVCKNCGRAGDKLYHRHCDDPTERPGPPRPVLLHTDTSGLEIAVDVNAIFAAYRERGVRNAEIAELIDNAVRHQLRENDHE